MTKIVNINDRWGDPVEFESTSETQCLIEMAQGIKACNYMTDKTVDEIVDALKEGVDYEVVEV